MEKTIEQRAEEAAHKEYGCDTCLYPGQCVRHGGKKDPFDAAECDIKTFISAYIEGATGQKSIDDEEYRVKREELIDKVLDTTIQYLQDHLIEVVLVGEDKQSGAWGYRILDERIKEEVKKRLK